MYLQSINENIFVEGDTQQKSIQHFYNFMAKLMTTRSLTQQFFEYFFFLIETTDLFSLLYALLYFTVWFYFHFYVYMTITSVWFRWAPTLLSNKVKHVILSLYFALIKMKKLKQNSTSQSMHVIFLLWNVNVWFFFLFCSSGQTGHI